MRPETDEKPMAASGDFRSAVDAVRERLKRGDLPLIGDSERQTEPQRPRVAGLPPLYATASLSDVPTAVLDSGGLRTALSDPCDVLVTGPNGVGKTHFAAALLNAWGGRWETTSELLVKVRSTFGRPGAERELFEACCDCRVLVLDDLTAVASTDFARATILAILDHRIGHLRPTVVTLYHSGEGVRKWDPSIHSRVSAFRLVKLSGPDRRAKKGGKQ